MSTSIDERQGSRAARDQDVFRRINARLTQHDTLSEITGSHMIVCECADLGCNKWLSISVENYQALRENARHFAVSPGHVRVDVEWIVEAHRSYVVVEKFGEAADAAEQLMTA